MWDGGDGGVLGEDPMLVVGCSSGGGRDSSVFSSSPGGGREGVDSVVVATGIGLWLGGELGCWWLVVASLLV